ncbi:hypothetical protein VNO78_06241 [Psophocarpus tetragonolobus]|uniref:TIR domain-containing protein n=1 Tax=Psophocarpus tetragonolobus TaxID=3891 RepID=A0AAN9SRV1_PSOTE
MACSKLHSSSSSGTKQHFDVFVSFRGEDTRNGFTDHLFAALQRKGIFAFRDNQNINKGELLEPELFQAIQQSCVFIVVFSKNYASSTWCMKELSEIVDWVEVTGRRVLPIFYDVTPSEEAKNLEAIVITQYPCKFLKATLRGDALSKMDHLKLLILENVNFSGVLNHLSNELRYLSWDKYPFTSLPSSFHSNQLVELILPYSNIKQLWKGTKYLPKLRSLNLKHSKNLIQMPDLKGVPHLTYLDLEGCLEIVRIDPSIGILKELVDLNLKDCKNLVHNLNIIFGLSSLRCLDLSGCSKLLNNLVLEKPRETEHLKKVDNDRSVIQLSPSSLYKVLMFPFHFLSSQKREDSLGLLVPYLSRFPCLLHLDLSFCNLLQIPDAIENLHSLEELFLGGNNFVTLPPTIKKLSKLRNLNLEHCKQLKYLPELPTPEEKTTGTHYGQVDIFDCPKLIDLEHCYSVIFSWLIQNLEVYLQPSISWGRIDIVIPGTQIPKWFKEQNEGSSISMDPPSSLMDNPNWIGVACCALFVTHDDPTSLGDEWLNTDDLCILYNVKKKEDWPKSFINVPIHFKKDLITVELDHLLIAIYSREAFISSLEDTVSLDNIVFKTYVFEPQGLHLDVKNCGYRWVFKDDLQQLNPNMMFSTSSSSRKRKLLTND